MIKVLGMGNALVDIMTSLDDDNILAKLSFPKGSMQLVNKESSNKILKATSHLKQVQAAGGSAANTIHGLSSLGIKTGFIGKIGKDMLGEFFEKDLKANHIEPNLFISENESGRAIALVSPDSERTFATFLGAAVELDATDLSDKLFKNYNYFHIEGYLVQNHSLLEKALHLAKKENLIISLDLASFNVVEENQDFLRNMIKNYVNIVFANEEEAKAFTGKEPDAALDEISSLCDIAVVKVGKKGSLIKRGNEITKIGIIGAEPIDTTGAGDLYASGFLYGHIKGCSLEKCGKLGALLSGKVIEEIGAKISSDKWNAVKQSVDKYQ
ncbi:MAG: adenosine kinase [Chlorobi bacterium]|nr:adenosine kinase [Chlorobiota bacterium]